MIDNDKTETEKRIDVQNIRYKPRLDYMIEKYGEQFKISDYGTVVSEEHPNWNIDVRYIQPQECYRDNYIIFLRQFDIQNILKDILSNVYTQCKVMIWPEWYAPANSSKKTTAQELLFSGSREDSNCIGVYCFTVNSPENRDRDFERAVQAIVEQGYWVHFQVTYTNERIYNQINSSNFKKYADAPANFFCQTITHDICNLDHEWQEGLLKR